MKIDHQTAESVLNEAVELAKSKSSLPFEWISFSRSILNLESKTWTAAFATMLLAKATDSRIDAFSIKVLEATPGSYSARNLCHKVLVPMAPKCGFTLRATGREPMNNQPFFRYERIDEIERVKNVKDLEFLLE